ncbi:MAG: alpha/beta fold hydrolase [Myxococcota bacterium]
MNTMTASDGVRIHYLEKGEGTPVVLIHGFTGSAEGNWFSNGVADALAKSHRVVAIDVRGHGRSDKPHDPAMYGDRLWRDVIELMDHLGIERAHVHGYSMGGGITASLLAHQPERMITASFGGSGIRETDPRWVDKVPADKEGRDPQEAEAASKLRASPLRDDKALEAIAGGRRERARISIDLFKVDLPVLAINGELDSPIAKTHRMERELASFKNVVLPGKSHLTAIMAGYIPDEYITSLVEFIDANDPV